MGKGKFTKHFGAILLVAAALPLIYALSTGEENIDKSKSFTERFQKDYNIYSLEVPTDLIFCGEKVPMELFDVCESLDRELLVNTYWQSQTLLFLKRANRFFPIIEPILKKNNIPDDFKYLAVAESGLMNVVSPSRAAGFWQFLKGTAQDFKLEVNKEVDERYHLEKATNAACGYLNKAYEKYGSWAMVAASYNSGRRALSNQIERQQAKSYYDLVLNEETARYVFRIIAIKIILENPQKYGFHIRQQDLYPEIETYQVSVDSTVNNFAQFAEKLGTNYKMLKYFNPWLREKRLSNPKKKTYSIKIPKDGARAAYSEEAK